MNGHVHPIFQDILRAHVAPLLPTDLDHTIALNRAKARTLVAISDAISPSPSAAHLAPVAPQPPSPATGALSTDVPPPADLRAIYESFFAPKFPTLDEHYMAPPAPCPTLAQTIAAGRAAADWHRDRFKELNGAYHRKRAAAIDAQVARLEALACT